MTGGDGGDGGGLAAHFRSKRGQAGGADRRAEAGGPSIAAAASFCFNFDVRDATPQAATDSTTSPASVAKKKKMKKKKKKRGGNKTKEQEQGQSSAGAASKAAGAASKPAKGGAEDHAASNSSNARATPPTSAKGAAPASGSSTFLKLRKATGSESEVARMQLRYGQGRRNLAATAQRALRRRPLETALASGSEPASAPSEALATGGGGFRFNFEQLDE